MITIDTYTGDWQAARNPEAPAAGTVVRLHVKADDRELDDFQRCLRASGKAWAFMVEDAANTLYDLWRVIDADEPE